MADVVTRFCPSPTGNPHVGMARTALFSWAFARHHGGRFVFRIEDTDASRDSEESYDLLVDVMHWLGLDWDEGPEVGGSNGPYRQSERMDVYADVAQRLLDAGLAYKAYDTAEELEERREKARAEGRPSGYDGLHRDLTPEQRADFEAKGREPVIRFAMPLKDWTFTDLVRGDITFGAENVQDFVIVRANGQPLYTLTNPTDDALMGVTHVLRGEDLLSSTPRQIALYEAFAQIGVGDGTTPEFGHLPYVTGAGNRKLSKRDPESNLLGYRDQGFLPEGLLNYLALLGWSIADDRDIFTLAEMVEAFEIGRVNPNPARFDLQKCEAINGSHVRLLPIEEVRDRLVPYLKAAGLVGDAFDARASHDAGRCRATRPRAHDAAHRGRRHAAVPVRERRRVRHRRSRPREAARRCRDRCRPGRARGAGGAGGVDDRDHRGCAAGESGRWSGTQAAGRVRSGARRRHGQSDLASAVRVARAARP